jgi:hypothetical protein
MTAHYGVELLLMIARTERSRSSGIGAHHRVDYAASDRNETLVASQTKRIHPSVEGDPASNGMAAK